MSSSTSPSHKKKRLTAADIKTENAAVAKKARINTITPVKSSVTIGDEINTVFIMPTPKRQNNYICIN